LTESDYNSTIRLQPKNTAHTGGIQKYAFDVLRENIVFSVS